MTRTFRLILATLVLWTPPSIASPAAETVKPHVDSSMHKAQALSLRPLISPRRLDGVSTRPRKAIQDTSGIGVRSRSEGGRPSDVPDLLSWNPLRVWVHVNRLRHSLDRRDMVLLAEAYPIAGPLRRLLIRHLFLVIRSSIDQRESFHSYTKANKARLDVLKGLLTRELPALRERFPGENLRVRDEGTFDGTLSQSLFEWLRPRWGRALAYQAADQVTSLVVLSGPDGAVAVFQDGPDSRQQSFQLNEDRVTIGQGLSPQAQPYWHTFRTWRDSGRVPAGWRVERTPIIDPSVAQFAKAWTEFRLVHHDLFDSTEGSPQHLIIASNILVKAYYSEERRAAALEAVSRSLVDGGVALFVNHGFQQAPGEPPRTMDFHAYTVFEKRAGALVPTSESRILGLLGYDRHPAPAENAVAPVPFQGAGGWGTFDRQGPHGVAITAVPRVRWPRWVYGLRTAASSQATPREMLWRSAASLIRKELQRSERAFETPYLLCTVSEPHLQDPRAMQAEIRRWAKTIDWINVQQALPLEGAPYASRLPPWLVISFQYDVASGRISLYLKKESFSVDQGFSARIWASA